MVKDIYRCLIGTIILILGINFGIEAVNILTVTQEINVIEKQAVRQACVFFSQETFREEGSDRKTESILLNSGSKVSGKFYKNNAEATIYAEIMIKALKKDSDFIKELKRGGGDIPYQPLRCMYKAFNNETQPEVDKITGKLLYSNMVTPTNMGITYLDKDIIERMYRWNLGSVLIGGMKNDISNTGIDSDGDYIKYKGLKVYVNDAKIEGIKYKMYDLSNNTDAAEFSKISHIGDNGTSAVDLGEYASTALGERNIVVVATVDYNVPIKYEGVTPLLQMVKKMESTKISNLFSGDSGKIDGYSAEGVDNSASEGEELASTPEPEGTKIRGSISAQERVNKNAMHGGSVVYYIMR